MCVFVYLLVDLVSSADGVVVEGVDGSLVVPGQMSRMQRHVGLHSLVEGVDQTWNRVNKIWTSTCSQSADLGLLSFVCF